MNYLIYILFSLYFVGVFQIVNLGSFGLQPAYPFLFLVYVVFFFKVFTNNYAINTRPIKSVNVLLLLQLVSGVSFIFVLSNANANVIQFLKSYGHFLFLTFFALIFGFINLDKKVWINVIKLWFFISIIINIFGIYQLFARAFDLPFGWIELTNASLTGTETETYQQLSLKFSNFYRATSIFSEPSALAGFNLTILGYSIYPLFNKENFKVFKSKHLLLSIVLLSVITLFLTFSLTGVLGFVVLLFAYLIFNRKINYMKIFKISMLTIIILIGADVLINYFFETSVFELFYNRITNILGLSDKGIVGESFDTRSNNFFYSLNIWQNSPIIGIGLGQTKFFGPIGFTDYGVLQSLIEAGIFGGLSFFFMFVFLLIDIFLLQSNINLLAKDSKFILSAIYYTITLLFIINLTSGNMLISIALWLFIAMAFSIITNLKREIGYDSKPINFFKKKLLPNKQKL